jgi:hypothetical protein
MIDLLIVAVLFLILNPLAKEDKYKEIERQQAMRRAMNRLQEKYRRYSL